MEISIHQLLPQDISAFAGLLRVFEDVFEMNDFTLPDDAYLSTLLQKKEFVVFVVRDGDTVIGGLTAYVLPGYYMESSEVYLYDLAVATSFQRKGIGRKLLQALTGFCRQNKFREFFVQADEADTHALEFYRSTGGVPQKVMHFNYPI
jgi:aminoglycoside 3-N-acetyltransferase I